MKTIKTIAASVLLVSGMVTFLSNDQIGSLVKFMALDNCFSYLNSF